MQNILELIDNEPRVSHRVVTQNTSNKIVAVQNLINKYSAEFAEFGNLHFKNEGLKRTTADGRDRGEVQQKTFYLNEPQATFLMTLLRNKPVVVEFKKKLVKAFYMMKQEHDQAPHAEINIHEILKVLVQNQTIMMQQFMEQPKQLQSLPLTPEQLGKIRGAINFATDAVLLCFKNDTASRIQKVIYTNLNNALGVASYIYIPALAFNEALAIIQEIERKHLLKYKEQRDEKEKREAEEKVAQSIRDYEFEMPQF